MRVAGDRCTGATRRGPDIVGRGARDGCQRAGGRTHRTLRLRHKGLCNQPPWRLARSQARASIVEPNNAQRVVCRVLTPGSAALRDNNCLCFLDIPAFPFHMISTHPQTLRGDYKSTSHRQQRSHSRKSTPCSGETPVLYKVETQRKAVTMKRCLRTSRWQIEAAVSDGSVVHPRECLRGKAFPSSSANHHCVRMPIREGGRRTRETSPLGNVSKTSSLRACDTVDCYQAMERLIGHWKRRTKRATEQDEEQQEEEQQEQDEEQRDEEQQEEEEAVLAELTSRQLTGRRRSAPAAKLR